MDLEKYKKSYQEIEAFQQTKNLDYYAHPARYYVKPFKIVGNVYYIGDSKVCSHLIDTGGRADHVRQRLPALRPFAGAGGLGGGLQPGGH